MSRTKEELRILYDKFDNDVAKRTRFFRLMLAIDQFLNVLIWNGSQDETVSSNIGRLIKAGKATKFDKIVCIMLNKLEYNHCKLSLGE